MSFFTNTITIDPQGIWRSVGLILLSIILLFRSVRPSFVIPYRYIHTTTSWIIKLIVGVFAILLLLLPLDIQIKTGERMVTSSTKFVEIVLDVSLSMSATDVEPSRFIVAQNMIDQLLATFENTTVGVIAFSGMPIIHIPFSDQIVAVRKVLKETTLADFPPTPEFLGTALGDALYIALEKIEQSDASNATIILISDGDASQGTDPLEVANLAAEREIPIHTISLGEEMAMLGIDTAGDKVIASLNSEMLESISSSTKGHFLRITDNLTMKSTLQQLIGTFRNDQIVQTVPEYYSLNRIIILLITTIGVLFFVWKVTLYMLVSREVSNAKKN